MRHLKKFNEALEKDYEGEFTEESLNEIKDYCELNLAYLLDVGMNVDCSDVIDDRTNSHECMVELSFDEYTLATTVLDQVIPFFKRIVNDYELGNFYHYSGNNEDIFKFHTGDAIYHVSYDELDKVEGMIMSKPSVQRNLNAGLNTSIYMVSFYIKDEK